MIWNPDQNRKNVGSDLDANCFKLEAFLKEVYSLEITNYSISSTEIMQFVKYTVIKFYPNRNFYREKKLLSE